MLQPHLFDKYERYENEEKRDEQRRRAKTKHKGSAGKSQTSSVIAVLFLVESYLYFARKNSILLSYDLVYWNFGTSVPI